MTIFRELEGWDPFDILWRNVFETTSGFNTLESQLKHPIDIIETDDGLQFEFAVVGLNADDIEINAENEVLRVQYTKPEIKDSEKYLYKGIHKRAFNLAWKISTRYNLNEIDAEIDKGLLIIKIPLKPESKPKRIEIKNK